MPPVSKKKKKETEEPVWVPYSDVPWEAKANGIRVKLTTDLTQYLPGLVVGSLGTAYPMERAQWGVIVSYDGLGRLDTLPRSLVVNVADISKPCPHCGQMMRPVTG